MSDFWYIRTSALVVARYTRRVLRTSPRGIIALPPGMQEPDLEVVRGPKLIPPVIDIPHLRALMGTGTYELVDEHDRPASLDELLGRADSGAVDAE